MQPSPGYGYLKCYTIEYCSVMLHIALLCFWHSITIVLVSRSCCAAWSLWVTVLTKPVSPVYSCWCAVGSHSVHSLLTIIFTTPCSLTHTMRITPQAHEYAARPPPGADVKPPENPLVSFAHLLRSHCGPLPCAVELPCYLQCLLLKDATVVKLPWLHGGLLRI